MNECVTIIIPIFNSEKYLDFCIRSVLNQTYQNFEVILVDDGCTDSSGIICDQYARIDSRVRVIHTENAGVVAAFYKGLTNTCTDYLIRVDSDDAINCYFIENLMCIMKETDADIVRTLARGFYEDNEINCNEEIRLDWHMVTVMTQQEMLEEICLRYRAPLIPITKILYKTKIFEGVTCPLVNRNEDEWIVHQLILNANKIAWFNQKMYYYRFSSEGMTRNFSIANISGIQAVVNRIASVKSVGGGGV